MSEASRCSVVEPTGTGHFAATSVHGGTVHFGTASGDGEDAEFTPVEPLLAAIGGCAAAAADVDVATARHAEPTEFSVSATGDRIGDGLGDRMTDLMVTFGVIFPDGGGADRARAILPRAVRTSHGLLCTVSRTIEIGTPARTTIRDA
ncbi:OsmC family protein [Streptomyces sp. NPDC055186]